METSPFVLDEESRDESPLVTRDEALDEALDEAPSTWRSTQSSPLVTLDEAHHEAPIKIGRGIEIKHAVELQKRMQELVELIDATYF